MFILRKERRRNHELERTETRRISLLFVVFVVVVVVVVYFLCYVACGLAVTASLIKANSAVLKKTRKKKKRGSPKGVLVPLFPSKIAQCSHVPTHFPNVFEL